MGRIRSDYQTSWQRRFLLWMAGEGSPLDAHMAEGMRGEALAHGEAERDLEEAERRRAQRYESDRRAERAAYEKLHAWSETRGKRVVSGLYSVLAVAICALIIHFLLATVAALPPFGEAGNPAHNEVSARYLERGLRDTGAVNAVAGMILDYRAFDTFGESAVLFAALCGVTLLLGLAGGADISGDELARQAEEDRHHEPKNDLILQTAAKILTPVVMLFGAYVVCNGHLSPGGGFSGGAVMGAGLMLYLNAFGARRAGRLITQRAVTWTTFAALLFYALAKSYSFYTGANHIPSGIPLGTPGRILSAGLILPLNVSVGLIVACTMYTLYALFRRGGL